MADKKIPGFVYIIIGAAVVLMSVFIGVNSGNIEKFALFILVGAVFIVIGFFKIVIKLDTERKQREHHAKHQAHHAQHQAQHQARPAQHQSHTQHPQHHQQQHKEHDQQHQHSSTSVVRCANCQVKIHPLFQFCPNCGHKLK